MHFRGDLGTHRLQRMCCVDSGAEAVLYRTWRHGLSSWEDRNAAMHHSSIDRRFVDHKVFSERTMGTDFWHVYVTNSMRGLSVWVGRWESTNHGFVPNWNVVCGTSDR